MSLSLINHFLFTSCFQSSLMWSIWRYGNGDGLMMKTYEEMTRCYNCLCYSGTACRPYMQLLPNFSDVHQTFVLAILQVLYYILHSWITFCVLEKVAKRKLWNSPQKESLWYQTWQMVCLCAISLARPYPWCLPNIRGKATQCSSVWYPYGPTGDVFPDPDPGRPTCIRRVRVSS